ncbi:MAG: ornithine--oxo-acid transaminase [Chitinophagales bacterium]|nr:ornithine--oxo-acid transaminase [Chitinophagales bacterium]
MISKADKLIELENQYGAHNYHPLPVVLEKGKGVYLYDVNGNKYLDFLSAYSAVNQGHCNKKIIKALKKQASILTLTSRAFYNNQLGRYEQMMCQLFGYQKLLPMNSGAEAVETAMKLIRKWGYKKKKINENEAIILFATHNFHGRTLSIISASNDPKSREGFGPFMPKVDTVIYNDISALEKALTNKNIAGFIVEPIQGEAGVIIPDDKYLKKAFDLCQKNKVLFVADEIQTGLGRTGKLLASHHSGIHPDMIILGKALSGGTMPISAVMCDDEVMLCIEPGEHGSTFGGNPLACAVAMAAIKELTQTSMMTNAEIMGKMLLDRLKSINSPLLKEVRGKGLMLALEINDTPDSNTAWELCEIFMKKGLLTKPTHGNIIRLAPPLIINQKQVVKAFEIIKKSIEELSEAKNLNPNIISKRGRKPKTSIEKPIVAKEILTLKSTNKKISDNEQALEIFKELSNKQNKTRFENTMLKEAMLKSQKGKTVRISKRDLYPSSASIKKIGRPKKTTVSIAKNVLSNTQDQVTKNSTNDVDQNKPTASIKTNKNSKTTRKVVKSTVSKSTRKPKTTQDNLNNIKPVAQVKPKLTKKTKPTLTKTSSTPKSKIKADKSLPKNNKPLVPKTKTTQTTKSTKKSSDLTDSPIKNS